MAGSWVEGFGFVAREGQAERMRRGVRLAEMLEEHMVLEGTQSDEVDAWFREFEDICTDPNLESQRAPFKQTLEAFREAMQWHLARFQQRKRFLKQEYWYANAQLTIREALTGR